MSFLRKEVNQILINIQNGDKESKNVLFNKTYNHLKIVVYPYLRNKNNVEDVISEAFLRIYNYVYSFNPKRDGYNWMCKIVENVAREDNKKYEETVSLDSLTNIPSGQDIENNLITKDEVQALLAQYPPRDQQLMRMLHFENRKIKEVAKILQMSKSNVHKRSQIILKEMSEKLKKGGKTSEKTSI